MINNVTISGLLTLDMHSLNNEGGEGNQLQTRMVHIVDGQGELQVVNAISGDMLKHIQADHLTSLSIEKELPLCDGCRKFDANRINRDGSFFESLDGEKNSVKIIDQLLPYCTVDDLEGILITRDNRSASRKSTVEFGWLVGLPDYTRTESYFHVKFDNNRGAGSGDESGANLGQNIFYRPASSGKYAVVVNLELSRIAFNDISREYTLSEEERLKRAKALLESVMFTFIKPLGAHRNTQNPHILGFEGIVSYSKSTVPAPSISALNSNYREEIEGIVEQFNRLYDGKINAKKFDSQVEFTQNMTDLIQELE
ncbi:DevR family CRISPR-associated autoregulator [Calidifontibacillus oryziterrae]|uniref:DevR family CRISPR-associated autoregulator n=1 Tax=Calidifontibacillus oryziterrae TaxID=1191699 RepID=UPI00030987EE|nr:DevR family CRISPR-associated autoregulator [Calidifontibacillus oryziterrae]